MIMVEEKKIIELAKECKKVLDEKKASDITILNLEKINSYLDYFIICSGNSKIHCRSLAKEVQRFFADSEIKPRNNPEMDSDWIVLDYSEIVIHIFKEETRFYYNLEKLWADAEIL